GADHPYGRPPKGTPAAIEAVDRAALVRFHAGRFAPSAAVLAIVGDVTPERAADRAAALFGDWTAEPASAPALPAVVPLASRRTRVLPMPAKAQADIAYGFVTIARTDPRYHAFAVMNNVLGQYGLGGRIGDRVRERHGLAYYAYSVFDPHVLPGPLMIRAGVDGAAVDRALAIIDEEVARMAAEGPTEAELEDARRFLIGSIPRMLETNAGIAQFLQLVEQFDLGLDYDVRLPALIGAVTRDAAHEAARLLSPDRAAIAVAGPYEGRLEGSVPAG
ncbi:MAG TPA: pitrilysin family protein, partial [Vicinamibacterales bacterium]|nr:pitrilysin family protein [Vicinamibacterales bacterium]